MCFFHMFLKACLVFGLFHSTCGVKTEKFSLLMPGVHPQVEDLYLCTPVRVDYSKSYYIVSFEPDASMDTAHHMLLYGCTIPGTIDPVWNCGEMNDIEERGQSYSPCQNGSQIIYAWARDAPRLYLPDGVGFKVGGDSMIQYLVLQVHYAHIDRFLDGSKDYSGVHLYYTEEHMKKLAGVLLLGTGGLVMPLSTEHMESACKITEDKIMHPFAFRTHTHTLGKVVSGYRVRRNDSGIDNWTLLGKKNPMLPQMFYPLDDDTITILPGDTVAARCTMKSNRRTITYIGPTNKHEMCNFYLMYWVDNTTPLNMKYCFTNGPPKYYWQGTLNNIPDIDASTVN